MKMEVQQNANNCQNFGTQQLEMPKARKSSKSSMKKSRTNSLHKLNYIKFIKQINLAFRISK